MQCCFCYALLEHKVCFLEVIELLQKAKKSRVWYGGFPLRIFCLWRGSRHPQEKDTHRMEFEELAHCTANAEALICQSANSRTSNIKALLTLERLICLKGVYQE